MFFYLIKNNYFEFIEAKDNLNILIYGSLFYLVTHLILINIISGLSIYFWLLLTLDTLSMYLIHNKDKNEKVEINEDFKLKNYDSEAEVDDIIDSMIDQF